MGRVHNVLMETDRLYRLWRARKSENKKISDPQRQERLKKYVLSEEQKREIDAVYIENYGKKVPYDWHRLISSYTRKFDPRYIPELLFIPEIEAKFVPREYMSTFADKNLLPILINGIEGVKTPKIFLACINGIFRTAEMELVSREKAIEYLYDIGRVFLKPTLDSNSGNGCGIYEFQQGKDIISNRTVEEIILSAGNNFNLQEILTNCEDVRKLHPGSLNTFRIVTYVWKNKIWHFPMILRIGCGMATLDNTHQGGIFIGVDDEGYLNECAFTETQKRYFEHPDSKIIFAGYQIPEIKRVLNALENVHKRFPQIGLISWDAIVNQQGDVVIIEMNLEGQASWVCEMGNGKPVFGENTEEILRWIRQK